MPYIKQNERAELDELIDALTTRIKGTTANTLDADAHGFIAGRLNYAVTRIVVNLLGPVKYWKIALYAGVLSNIASEFYRKLAAPYEDLKIAENGDVYPPA
jgi:hypothetical protein